MIPMLLPATVADARCSRRSSFCDLSYLWSGRRGVHLPSELRSWGALAIVLIFKLAFLSERILVETRKFRQGLKLFNQLKLHGESFINGDLDSIANGEIPDINQIH